MIKKKHEEEHVDEAWLLPYSDMLTLLLALFIVMFAMGQTDKAKFEAMAEKFNVIFSGGSGVMNDSGNSIIPMNESGNSQASENNGTSIGGNSDSKIEQDKMLGIKRDLEEEINKQGYGDKIKVDLNEEGLDISIQDVVLFDSGKADVLNDMSPLLLKISEFIRGLDNNIRIAGYTDNVPISNSNFRSNWDLSAIRAINVMNFMVNSGGISEDKLSIQAYGQYKPTTSNDTEEGKAKNRRVEIIIVRNYPTDQKENDINN